MARMSHGQMAHAFDQWVGAVEKWRSEREQERTETVREEQVAALRGEVAEHQEALSVERLHSVAALEEERERVGLERLQSSEVCPFPGTCLCAWYM